MADLFCPSQKCNIMKLLPFFMDTDFSEDTIAPSKLLHELQTSTEERLEQLSRPTRKFRISTEINTFSRNPDIVVFQNFKVGVVYTTTLALLNLHPVSRHLRVITPSSPYFKIKHPAEDRSAKIAPGMSYILNIMFSPLESMDYTYRITFLTDGENFDIPIYGIGPRALVNLPDHIKLPITAIRISSEKSLILHNFGSALANFVISCTAPFCATPYRDILQSGRMMELKISCKPSKVGLVKGYLEFVYNDINLKVSLECEVKNVDIYLDKHSVIFEDIFMGLKKQGTITIHNRSNHFVNFQWKLHKSYAMDKLETSKMIQNLESLKELEKTHCNKLEKMNIIDYEGNCSIWDRTFQEEVRELETNNLYLYQNPIFDILPLTGQFLPNQSLTFTVTFSPIKNEHYESWAYLDVTGRDDRLPLNFQGLGKGPYVSLNVKVLNINDVFLCATHNYEIVAKNEGNIPATINFKDTVTDFGATIHCVPKRVYLPYQDSCAAFIIRFYSKIQGKFIERIEFVIQESQEILHFLLIGNVVCPLLTLNIREIDFGIVPYGYQPRKEFKLINNSQVPIDFHLQIDGEEENDDNMDEKEIHFHPDHGIVDVYTNQTVVATLQNAQVAETSRDLKVNMWGSKNYSISIPVKYYCIYPFIRCVPTEVRIKFCFLNYEYKRIIKLTNEADVPGSIAYTPIDRPESDHNICCNLNKKELFINPRETIDIELTIITKGLGRHTFPIIFTVAGGKAEQICKVVAEGQGPVVSYEPDELDFGNISLLETITKELILMNDSPIKAYVDISVPSDSIFQVDRNELEIEPEAQTSIMVSVYLTDPGRRKTTINLQVQNGELMPVRVFGEGVGYSILCDPNLKPEYNAKAILTHQKFVLPVTFTNRGKKSYKIRWTPTTSIKHLKDKMDHPDIGYHFSIEPEYFVLAFNESKTIEIHGFSKQPKLVEEEFYCFAVIENSSKMKLIMSFIMMAEFVEPSVDISKPNLDIFVPDLCDEIEDHISIVNDSDLPVTIDCYTSSDYYLIQGENVQSHINQEIPSKSKFTTKIKYAPHLNERRYFKQTGEFTVNYFNHPNEVKLPLNTEVCFPTIKLIPAEYEFDCLPLHSYRYARIIIQNITFLPAKYKWEFLEEFFEIEELAKIVTKNGAIVNTVDLSSESDESSSITEPELREVDLAAINREMDELDQAVEEFKLIYTKDQYMIEMKKILLPILETLNDEPNDLDMVVDLKDKEKPNAHDISSILTIEPFEGELGGFEYVVATIGFFPPPNTKVVAKALCKLEGAEQETLLLKGMSSEISYEIDKTYVELGQQLFCEICEEKIILTNNGYCEFSYFITCDEVREGRAIVGNRWLNVSPNTLLLEPGDSVTLEIKYFPGNTGEFYEAFLIEIGYLEPFRIKLHGYSVFAQIYLGLPRPLIYDLPSELLYEAMQTLSLGYINSLQEINNENTTLYQHIPGCPPEMMKVLYKQLKKDGWVVVSKNNYYPSIMDIDMSIERLLIRQHVLNKKDILMYHTFKHKIGTIPDFITPPYILDFGYVVRERSVCYTVLIVNYGPIKAEIRLLKAKNSTLEKNKFRTEFKCKKLDVGHTVELFVLFKPTEKRYPELDAYIEDGFWVIVRHGATIPIKIKAVVTLPRVSFKYTCVDFGGIRLGYCLRRSIIISNDGFVLSKWNVEIESRHSKMQNAFFVRPCQGELQPGKKGLLNIYFVPTLKGFNTAKLLVNIEGNRETIVLKLCGHGIESTLAFNTNNLLFGSALPYSQDSNMFLMIQNVTTVPLEYCFADFDEEYEEEKLWIKTYLNHHNLKRVFVPQRAAADKISGIFQDNFLTLLNEVRQRLLEHYTRHATESDMLASPVETEVLEDPLENFAPNEVIELLNEHIESTHLERLPSDTDMCDTKKYSHLNTAVVEPEQKIFIDPKGQRSGIFIIFHGGPNTEFYKAANKAGIKTSMPVYSIDRLIYESLVENDTKPANDINTILDNMFNTLAYDEDLIPVPGEDEYDLLMRKVYVVLNNKEKKKGSAKDSKKGSAKDSEKSSKKSGKEKKAKETDTLKNIPVDLFIDLLHYKFRTFTIGVIIESLFSEFLRKINIALNCLLSGIGNALYVQVIILSYTLQNYIKEEEEKLIIIDRELELARLEQEAALAKLKEEAGPDTKKGGKSKSSKSSGKSGKSSKSGKSKKQKPKNYTKQILKSLPKPMKVEFDAFQAFLDETFHISQFWDKRNCILTKPYMPKSKKGSSKADKSSTKGSTKDSKAATKRRKSSLEEKESVNINEFGILLWLVNNANKIRPLDFAETVSQALRESIVLEVAERDLEYSLEEHVEESSVNFSVIQRPKERSKVTSDTFVITNCEPPPEKNDNQVFAMITSRTSSEKKRGPKRKVSGLQSKTHVEQVSATSLEKGREDGKLIPRCILQPEEIALYKFAFYPQKCGEYYCNFAVQIIGLNKIYPIKCYAICELPIVDFSPESVFPRTVMNYRDKALTDNFVYIKDMNIFDFGTILVNVDKPYEYNTNFLLKNISDLQCEVKANVSENEYSLESKSFTVEPREEQNLTVSVRASKTDFLTANLYISIKNNPKCAVINLITKPCKLEFTIAPKVIFFDKIPLKYPARKKITLTNASSINLWWKFVDFDWALEIYQIPEFENSLGPFSIADVYFIYEPEQEESHPKNNLEIQVFDLNHSDEVPIYKDYIVLQAESVMYNIEYSDHLDLGEIKGRQEHKIPFTLLNKGKCQVAVKFAAIENPLDKDRNIRKFVQLKNQNTVLLPNKLFTYNVMFNPTKTLDFKEVPIFVCSFLEFSNLENVISSFVVKMSGVVHLSCFDLCPTSDMHFGYQQILSTKKQILEIANSGKFAFSYTIVSLKQELEKQRKKEMKEKKGKGKSKGSSKSSKGKGSSKKSKSTKTDTTKKSDKSSKKSKGSKKSKDSKSTKKKIKITKLNVEGFSIVSSTGEVEPNETAEVQIECTPREKKEYSEILIIYVSEPYQADINGRQVTLHVTGSEPTLNLNDFNKMFKEQFMVDKMENFICPKNIGSHCVFDSSDITLHFKNVCINTTNLSKMYIQNTGHVAAQVTAKIIDSTRDVFTVYPDVFEIHPYSTEAISIVFTPDSIEDFNNKLEISYNSTQNNNFMLSLNGEGLIPQIALLEPTIKENNQCLIDISPTYVGHISSKKISMQNVGLIPAKVIMEICENFKETFTLVACDDTFALLNISGLEEFKNAKYSTLVNLLPGEIANFDLVFRPCCEQILKTDLKIHTVNNPFEIIRLTINAQSYYHDICLEGLTAANRQETLSNSSITITNYTGYGLNFGFSVLNILQKKRFTIRNNSDSNIYKFEFSEYGQLLFIPRVGHLKPLAHKEVIVTFSTKKPLYLDKEIIGLNLNKIEYVNPDVEPLSWDERQKFVYWEDTLKPNNESLDVNETIQQEEPPEILEGEELSEMGSFEKIQRIDDRPEPEFNVISETSDTIPLFFSIIADYSSYTCQVCEIKIPDTYLSEKSEVNFDIENNGLIPLQIEWNFTNNILQKTRALSANNMGTPILQNDLLEKSSTTSTSLFSSDCGCSCMEEDIFPFTITPKTTSIDPNKYHQFSVNFSPTSIAQCSATLSSKIIGLDPNLKDMDLKVTAMSLLPVYYFEIAESDYLNRRPEETKKCGSEDYPQTKILEFESVGAGVSSIRKFNIVNPTNELMSYRFESLEENPCFSYFHCHNPHGFVIEQKKSEIVFNFKPREFGNFEAYYMFHVLGKHLEVPFLLAGKCRQPYVYFTTSHITIKPTVLTVEVSTTATLRNEEDMELSFKFVKESLFNEYQDQQLEVAPKSGKIDAKADVNIRLKYKAEKTGEVNFYIQCVVEKMRNPLRLNVTANCLEILPSVTFVDKNTGSQTLEEDKENIINFGNIIPRKKESLQFTISNIGQTGFFYHWNFNTKPIEHLFDFSVDKEKEFLPSNNESNVIMALEALRKGTLEDFQIKLTISYGPTYTMNVNATAEKQLCTFSFTEYNFGYCVVQRGKTSYYNVALEFNNTGKISLMLENCYVNSEDLTVAFKSALVLPSSSQHIAIYFHPMKVGQHQINVPFTVNAVQYIIKILGEAVKIHLKLVKMDDKHIDLGPTMIGSTITYPVEVINLTPTQVEVFFNLRQKLSPESRPIERMESEIRVPEIPPPVKKEKKEAKGKGKKGSKKGSSKGSKKSKKDSKKGKKEKGKGSKSTKGSKKSKGKDKKGKKKKKEAEEVEVTEPVIEPPKKTILDFLTVSPSYRIQLDPNKKCEIVIQFSPTERIENFLEQIFYGVQDYMELLCIVKGECMAPEFCINETSLTFSNIVIGLKHSLNVLLKNTGDLLGRFKWELDRDTDVFKICPSEGFVSPGSELKVWVTFEPKSVECLVKVKAKCTIEDTAQPLELMLAGNSVKLPNPTATLNFNCPVRQTVEQTVKVPNMSKSVWPLHPIISNEQFCSKKEVSINPESEYPLVIAYCPKQMTTLTPHNGTLFLPQPEGKAILYELVGTTLPPLPIERIELEVNCKTNHTELLRITNWLNLKQCFSVKTELASPVTTKSLYKVTGYNLIELLPNNSKDYRWGIYVINEIPLDFKVIFTNIETKEYMFYEIALKVLPSGPLETINLTACVRKPVNTIIKLHNPIDLPVTFNIDCINVPGLTLEKIVAMDPYSTYDLNIDYHPMKTDHVMATLEAKCPELGTFTYCLNLTAHPPLTESVIKFKTELGETTSRSIFWENTFGVPVDFFAMFDHPAFSTEKSPPISVGETRRITFTFEPCDIGVLQSKVVISSVTTGDYIYPLIGECLLPKPKGPFLIKSGGSTTVNFTNPFMEEKLFHYAIDSNVFYLRANSEIIKPKKPTKIIISMQPIKNLESNTETYSVTAKLTVYCEDNALNDIKWVFYIQGD